MIRLFVSTPLSSDIPVPLSEKHIHYLLHVMRQRAGDMLLLFNGHDGEWLGEIKILTKKSAEIRLTKQIRIQTQPDPLILCPALIKKENMDLVFQKATELGVTNIYPLLTERTVISHLNMERTNLILQESAEQSERLTVPTLYKPQKLNDFLQHLDKSIQPVCLSERGKTSSALKPHTNYAFCIGPEGGWTTSELELFNNHNTLFWHLGDTILRAETASITAIASYQFLNSLNGK